MAIEILSAVPDEFFAGDTVKILLSGSKYPAPTWAMGLSFNGPEQFTATAEASGDDHLFTITATSTEEKPPGVYGWALRAASGDDRVTVDSGSVWIKANPAIATTSWNRECLTLLRAHIKGRLPAGLTSHTINGTSINKMSLPEAIKLEAIFAAKVAAEDAAKVGVHGNDSRTIQIYFGR